MLLFGIVLMLIAGCSRPKTIGRSELKQIFKQAFLVNAYYDELGWGRIMLDSLDVYGPILKRHGYDVEDLEHTVNNFARKKSSNLSDVVEQAITELKDESSFYDKHLAAIDTMYARAGRALRREVLWRDSIVVRKVADTTKLRIDIPAEEGTYEISYSYLIDSLDKNRTIRTTYSFIDSTEQRYGSETEYMTSRDVRRRPAVRKLTADSLAVELEILFGSYPQKDLKRPYIRVDSLRVVYYLPREQALDSIAGHWNNLGKYGYQAYSDTLRPNPPWLDTLAVGGVR